MSSQLVETAFSFLDGDLSPESALSVLGGSRYGIVLDAASNPVSVVSRADLTGAVKLKASGLVSPTAWLPPTILIPSGTTIGEIVESRVAGLLDLGLRGLVVMGAAQAVGVLPGATLEALRRSLSLGEAAPLGAAFSDAVGDPALGGSINVPTFASFCREPNCGYPIKIVYVPKLKPLMCKNPQPPRHRLRLSP